MKPTTKIFLILWFAGMAGVLSILLMDMSKLIDLFQLPPGVEKPSFTPFMKFLTILQPAVLLSIAVLLGVVLARKVGLSSPVVEALASGAQVAPAFIPQVVPGLVGGLAGGIGIVVSAIAWKPFLPPEVVTRIAQLGNLLPVPTRLLYGGFTEELFLRWGVMTLLVWIPWRVLQKGERTPKRLYYISAILISSVLFGIGHLPVASLLVPELSLALTTYVIVANSIFGLIAGYLYWRKGLESTILAHMIAHIVLISASYFGGYF